MKFWTGWKIAAAVSGRFVDYSPCFVIGCDWGTPMTTTDIAGEAQRVWFDYLKWLERYFDGTWLFRGQGEFRQHSVQPAVGRACEGGYDVTREKQLLDEFVRLGVLHEPGVGFSSWDWLAIGQHYGLPTRLLDWSDNPFVALWFAVSAVKDLHPTTGDKIDVVVLALSRATFDMVDMDPIKHDPSDVFDGRGKAELQLVRPPSRAARITNQRGAFTWHKHPDQPIDSRFSAEAGNMFTIPGYVRTELESRLSVLGIDESHIKPDLEGLARSLRWKNQVGLSLGTSAR